MSSEQQEVVAQSVEVSEISDIQNGTGQRLGKRGFAVDRHLASRAGKKGIRTIRAKYGEEVFRVRGSRGGQTTRERFGREHFRRLGRMGAEARRRKRNAL